MYYENVTEFKVTEEHLKLLKEMFVEWNYDEFGAPSIDPKRPFGNSAVESDMLDILGIDYGEDSYEYLENNDELRIKVDKLYKDLKICLQILVNDLSIKVGKYKRTNEYNAKTWVYIGDE